MTAIIFTIGMRIGRLTALVTFGDYIRRNTLSQPVVKNKIFTNKTAF